MNVVYIGNDSQWIDKLSQEKTLSVTIKRNGLEAMQELQKTKAVDLVVSEYDLPGNNGLYFYQKMAKDLSVPSVPYILLQKEFSQTVFKNAFNMGVQDYFVVNSTSYDTIVKRIHTFTNKTTTSSFEAQEYTPPTQYKIPLSKRIFDVVIASSLLILLSPLLLITMLAIRLESKGKIYYTSKRVGRKTFDFYKLRSMRVGADAMLKKLAEERNQYNATKPTKSQIADQTCPKCEQLPEGHFCSPVKYDGTQMICDHLHTLKKGAQEQESASFIKIVDDPRITRIGKFIRNTSIDELPQLINVIKGDMSLVGNRPLPVYEAEFLTRDQLSKRFLAPAGITGLWQVELRGKGGEMSEEERIELDNKYADYFTSNTYSFWFDMKILLRTVPALFQQSAV